MPKVHNFYRAKPFCPRRQWAAKHINPGGGLPSPPELPYHCTTTSNSACRSVSPVMQELSAPLSGSCLRVTASVALPAYLVSGSVSRLGAQGDFRVNNQYTL